MQVPPKPIAAFAPQQRQRSQHHSLRCPSVASRSHRYALKPTSRAVLPSSSLVYGSSGFGAVFMVELRLSSVRKLKRNGKECLKISV
ncbi:hypothetical protein GWI33_021841 [Rhynchophorus ferrugineus]|uniref:Uncharacterized protein n=1 Tax=Rhynchophorus ferrugineus TaxID=354439 RepID=A0A834MLJ6_RHYFE|nr:hypothetical protein GWI33_021841 [Rhynchophorus ferrugineus]